MIVINLFTKFDDDSSPHKHVNHIVLDRSNFNGVSRNVKEIHIQQRYSIDPIRIRIKILNEKHLNNIFDLLVTKALDPNEIIKINIKDTYKEKTIKTAFECHYELIDQNVNMEVLNG